MLNDRMEPTLKMLSTTQKARATEKVLQDLTQYENSINISGNFRAQQRRINHDNSKLVFPEAKKSTEKYKTHYTLNFKLRPNCQPSTPRPCSPTRRNNPHPSKNFLTWRIPTRVFDYGKSKDRNVSFLNSNIDDTYLSFYDDYTGKRDHLNEVNTKLLLELTRKYSSAAAAQKRDRRQRSTVELGIQTDNQLQGLTLPSLLRKSWSPDQSALGLPKKSPKSRLSPLFIKSEFQPLFQSWYDAATSKDKETAVNTVAHLEENYIQKALESALKPDAIEAIEDWLLTADEEERVIAMQFIQTILLHSFEKSQNTERHEKGSPSPTTHLRNAQTTPVDTNPSKHHQLHHKRKGCDICGRKELEAALQKLQCIAAIPQEVPGITELLNPLHPGVLQKKDEKKRFLHGRSDRRLNRPKNEQHLFKGNIGSLFVSQKPKCRHFTIHPEWF